MEGDKRGECLRNKGMKWLSRILKKCTNYRNLLNYCSIFRNLLKLVNCILNETRKHNYMNILLQRNKQKHTKVLVWSKYRQIQQVWGFLEEVYNGERPQ